MLVVHLLADAALVARGAVERHLPDRDTARKWLPSGLIENVVGETLQVVRVRGRRGEEREGDQIRSHVTGSAAVF